MYKTITVEVYSCKFLANSLQISYKFLANWYKTITVEVTVANLLQISCKFLANLYKTVTVEVIVANLLQISCIFFANWLAFFLHFFCILILAIKMDLHFFAFFLHFFLHPDFWGSIFQLHFFCIFSPIYLF